MQNIPKFREYRFVGWRVYSFIRKSTNVPILFLKTRPLSLKFESQESDRIVTTGKKTEKMWTPRFICSWRRTSRATGQASHRTVTYRLKAFVQQGSGWKCSCYFASDVSNQPLWNFTFCHNTVIYTEATEKIQMTWIPPHPPMGYASSLCLPLCHSPVT